MAKYVKVVYGRWAPFHSEVAGDIQYCTACGIGFSAKTDYCPHCGAMMVVGDDLMPNYKRMWNSLKRELQQLEEHYSDMRLNYAQKGQPTLAAHFKERGDGVAEAIMYMDLAEDDAFDE